MSSPVQSAPEDIDKCNEDSLGIIGMDRRAGGAEPRVCGDDGRLE